MIFAWIALACSARPTAAPTPGPIPTPRPTATTTGRPQARFYPAAKPSAARGASVYARDCAICHGATGKGNGIAGLPLRPKPTDFTDLDYMRRQRPDRFYQAITKGVLGSAMLAFDGALDEEERRDVLFYTWSLATTPERIEVGRQLYGQQCTRCHGWIGDGRELSAPRTEPPPADLSDPRTMFALTSADVFSAISDASARSPDHSWPDLTDDQRWAIVDYVWTLMYETIE